MMRAVAVVLALAGAAGCGGQRYEVPERTPRVAAEEARVAALLERHESESWGGRSGTCSVRVLGMEGATTFAWAHCTFPTAESPDAGVSTAYRIDGDEVRGPLDGAGYGDSIRSMFPGELASAVLENPDRLRPDPPQRP
jgi:hypothetical protein